jgi:hypothetical protein
MEAMLAFFRKLTPQALYFAVQLDFGRIAFDAASWRLSFSFFVCAALWLLSFSVSNWRFLEDFVRSKEPLDQALKELGQSDIGRWRQVRGVAKAVWRLNKRGLFAGLIFFFVANASLVVVGVVAYKSTIGFLEAKYLSHSSAPLAVSQKP